MSGRKDRTLWLRPGLDDYEEGQEVLKEVLVPCQPRMEGLEQVEPNLVSSRLYEASRRADPYRGWHSPVLDIDFEVQLIPSTTKGHYHLYLDGISMEWDKYRKLLQTLAECKVIEQGFCDASLRREMTCVRLPHVKKPHEGMEQMDL